MGSIAVFFMRRKWRNKASKTYMVNAYLIRTTEIFGLTEFWIVENHPIHEII